MPRSRPTLVILAAGTGRRYGGRKQLAPIGPHGETLLEYSAFDALRAGFGRIVLVVRPAAEAAFRRRLDPGLAARAPVVYAHQRLPREGVASRPRSKPWGTAEAVLVAEPHLDGPFAVVNADDFYGLAPFTALAEFLAREPGRDGRRLAVAGFPVGATLTEAGAVSRAVLETGENGRLASIVERLEVWRRGGQILFRDARGHPRPLTGEERVSMNMWGLTPRFVAALGNRFQAFVERFGDRPEEEFRLPEAIQEMVRERRFEVEILPGGEDWCGLTFREDEARVRERLASWIEQRRYPGDLWS